MNKSKKENEIKIPSIQFFGVLCVPLVKNIGINHSWTISDVVSKDTWWWIVRNTPVSCFIMFSPVKQYYAWCSSRCFSAFLTRLSVTNVPLVGWWCQCPIGSQHHFVIVIMHHLPLWPIFQGIHRHVNVASQATLTYKKTIVLLKGIPLLHYESPKTWSFLFLSRWLESH